MQIRVVRWIEIVSVLLLTKCIPMQALDLCALAVLPLLIQYLVPERAECIINLASIDTINSTV